MELLSQFKLANFVGLRCWMPQTNDNYLSSWYLEICFDFILGLN